MAKTDFLSHVSETIIRIISLDYFVIKHIIRKFLKQADGDSVFDIGCGTGILAPLFPVKAYVGVDMDPKLVEYARKHHPGYTFLVGDATKIRLKKRFHTIVVVGVIHHLNDVEARRMVTTIHDHLTKGGHVLIIEAIPPLFKWNILGQIDRKMDKGAFIRKLDDYKRFFAGKLKIEKAYNQLGGIVDYGVFVLNHK